MVILVVFVVLVVLVVLGKAPQLPYVYCIPGLRTLHDFYLGRYMIYFWRAKNHVASDFNLADPRKKNHVASPGGPAAPPWRRYMIFIWRGPKRKSCSVSICPDLIHAWPAGRPGWVTSSNPENRGNPLISLCFEQYRSQNEPRRRLGLRRIWSLAGLSPGLRPRKKIM